MRSRLSVVLLLGIAVASFGAGGLYHEFQSNAYRLARQRDELAWRAIYLLTNANPLKRHALEMQLNRTINDIEAEDGDDTLFDWDNDPHYQDRPETLSCPKEKK